MAIVCGVLQILINLHPALFNDSIQFDLFSFCLVVKIRVLYKVFDTRSMHAPSLNSSNPPMKFGYSVTQ